MWPDNHGDKENNAYPLVIHFLVPFTMYLWPSWLLTAVVLIFATSDPASGSVIAMHARLRPQKKSGRKRSCNCLLPNLKIGGTPKAIPTERWEGRSVCLMPVNICCAVVRTGSDTPTWAGKPGSSHLIVVNESVEVRPVFHLDYTEDVVDTARFQLLHWERSRK